MSVKLSHKYRWFWYWEDEKEEAWLRQMANQGLHLGEPGPFGRYTFVEGKPRDVVYRLDFIQPGKKDEMYYQLFRDTGWEHAGEMGGWQYWRRVSHPEDNQEIFTDNESKVRKYNRLLTGILISIIPVFSTSYILFIANVRQRHPVSFVDYLRSTPLLVFLAALVFIAFLVIRIAVRIRQLKRV